MSAKTRTVLCPPLSPYHFQFLETIMRREGLDFHVLPEGGRESVELGLRYVNNDACYPAMIVIGQFLEALRSGKYDPGATDCFYAQTGGACRASNYVPLLRRALDDAGFPQVRVLAMNAQGNSGAVRFSISAGALWRAALGLIYGDTLMRLLLRTRPYEHSRGASGALYSTWSAVCRDNVERGSWRRFKADIHGMAEDFSAVPIDPSPRPRVGVVGEILVKYHSRANERLVEVIEAEGGEAVVPDLASFLLYCMYDPIFANKNLGAPFWPRVKGVMGMEILERMRNPVRRALSKTRFGEPHRVTDMLKSVDGMINPANQAGEGWLLASEMKRLMEEGVKNVICVQPFACLPNHVTGKGVMKELRRSFKGANIMALDYDPGVSNVNQLNRIKLLMASASV